MNFKRNFLLTASSLLLGISSYAQLSDKLKDGIRVYTDTKDSSHFIRFNMTSQAWARYTQNDPGTNVVGTTQSKTTDFSIRRIRFVAQGQLTDRIYFFTQFGQNNDTYLGARKAGSFFHDVTADYAFIKKYLSIGMGLNGWNGPSRFSNTSVANILVLDPPAYQEVTNDTYDQFVRRLGVYAKGKISKLDYRISVGKPFVSQTGSGIGALKTTVDVNPKNTNTTFSTFSTLPPQMVYQGYFMWQFLDQESNAGPSTNGTYLGKKKVFNIGAGFYYQDRAMAHYSDIAKKDTAYQAIQHFAVDLFYDVPVNKEKGTAFSLYACYSNYNYGTDFLRVSGANNGASAANTQPGVLNNSINTSSYGNAYAYLGTGSVYYAQVGYKFKDNLLGEQGTLQPYANCQLANYDRLNQSMYVYNVGVNWLIKGQGAKLTFDYQNRPYFVDDGKGTVKQQSRLGQFVAQFQIAF